MSKKKKDAAADAEGGTEEVRKKRSNLLPAVIVCIGLLGGGYLMSGKGGGDAEAAPAEEPEEEVLPGEVVPMDAMTLNLADGRYLRMGIAVELVEGIEGKEWVEEGAPSRYQDMIIEEVGHLSSAEVLAPDGRDGLKSMLRHGGHELFEEEFHEVFLTEFIVQ